MRDRLIELIASKVCSKYVKDTCLSKWNGCCGECECGRNFQIGDIADHLLENGAMIPPVNIGDIVYKIYSYEILEITVTNVIMGLNPSKCKVYTEDKLMLRRDVWYQDSFGKQLFFTREQAERVLEELKNGTR